MTNTNEAVLREAINVMLRDVAPHVRDTGHNAVEREIRIAVVQARAALAATATVAKDGGEAVAWRWKWKDEILDTDHPMNGWHADVAPNIHSRNKDNIIIEPLYTHTHSEASAEQPAGEVELPNGWVALSMVFDEDMNYPEEVAYGPADMMARLGKKLDKYYADVIAKRLAAPISEDTGKADSSSAAPSNDERMARLGRYVTEFATKGGWEDDGEGAFEFIQRHSYTVGFEDAGGKVGEFGTQTNGSRWPISALAAPSPTGESLSARNAALEEAACLVMAGCGYNWQSIAEAIRALKTVPGEPT